MSLRVDSLPKRPNLNVGVWQKCNIKHCNLHDCYGDKIILMIDNDHKQCN